MRRNKTLFFEDYNIAKIKSVSNLMKCKVSYYLKMSAIEL